MNNMTDYIGLYQRKTNEKKKRIKSDKNWTFSLLYSEPCDSAIDSNLSELTDHFFLFLVLG